MNNKYFRFIQIVVTILAFYYLFNFFVNEIDFNNLEISFSIDSLGVVTLLFFSNVCHSLGWSRLFSREENFEYSDTYLFGMKSHIGKYSFVKFGNFFIRLSQDYEQISKKRFLGKAAIEQITLIVFALAFGLFQISTIDSVTTKIFTVLVINLLIIFLFNKFFINKKIINIEVKTLWYYLATTFIQFSSLIYFFYSLQLNGYIYFAAIYLFSSGISVLVSIIPAGLGVKESIFVFIISEVISKSDILSLLVGLRILFILSDILSYLYSVFLLKNKN
tara:strand:+ start:1347 stop:2174 length:828 start_codon:yes stop_codon:yes gene_type:complete